MALRVGPCACAVRVCAQLTWGVSRDNVRSLEDSAEDVGESKRADRAVLLVERDDRVLGALLRVKGVELGNGEVPEERRRRPCLAPDALWSSRLSKLSSFRERHPLR